MIYTNKISRAIDFASRAHENQKRKVLNYPYISHPLSVLFLVSKFTDDEDVLVASILHDVVEDTNTNSSDIEIKFGKKVRDIIDVLTEDNIIENIKERKDKQLEKFKKAKNETLLIKLADIIHNFCDILTVLEHYPKEIYLDVFGGNIKDKIKNAENRLNIIKNTWPENPLLPEAEMRFKDYKKTLERLNLIEL
jgi:(p)ppGpp synthase/HD superfamily hydrolase